MRTEDEMMHLILSCANTDDRIRVVGMEGSRTNKSIASDHFQDYDITYLVTDMKPFVENEKWLDVFGERIFMQKPENMSLYPPELGNWFSYLMLFEDGNRIDLTIVPISELDLYLSSESLLEVLLDKDGLVKEELTPSDISYYVEKPTAQIFDDCCNEFWWVSTYVAKGICRQQFLYAAEHLNKILRKELYRMLEWRIGVEHNFSINIGKSYKYLEKYLSEDLWKQILATYEMHSYEKMWEALSDLQNIFRKISMEVAEKMSFVYPEYDKNITNYINSLCKKY